MADPKRAPRKSSGKGKTVLLRIKRFGDQFATCGVGVRPPEHLVGDARMKRLCPKLVPGQVIELPADHPLARKRGKHVEQVYETEPDEFIRPWVFKTAADAVMANPSKSRLGPEQILAGLQMAEGAIENAPKHRRKAQKKREEELRDDDDDFYDDDRRSDDEPDLDDEPELEDEDEVAERSRNRVNRSVKDDAKPVDDDDEDEDEDKDVPVRASRRPRRKPDAEDAVRAPRASRRSR